MSRGVLHNALVLARSVDSQRQYVDLTAIASDPPQYGTFDPISGAWLETFDHVTCLQRLQQWEHRARQPGQPTLPYSEVTIAGRRWLVQYET